MVKDVTDNTCPASSSPILIQKHVSWLPSVIFGIFAVLSAITLAFMPETKGKD